MKKKLFAVVIVAVAAFLLFQYYRSSQPVVETVAARRGTATLAVYGTVKVVPTVSFSVRARTAGVLKYNDALAHLTNLIGFEVKNGDVLGEVVSIHLGNPQIKTVLPSHDFQPVGFLRA